MYFYKKMTVPEGTVFWIGLKLEGNNHLRPQGLCMVIGRTFIFQIIVFNLSHHILGNSQVAADHPAFEAFRTEGIIMTVHGVGNVGSAALIVVFTEQAPGNQV